MIKSFSNRIKSELLEIKREDRADFLAFSYALFLFSSAFGINSMYIKTENEAVARAYMKCAKTLADVKASFSKSKGGMCRCEIKSESDRRKVLNVFSLTGNELSNRVNRTNIDTENCYPHFLAGAFLACGTAADPKKDYHLEFCIAYKKLCDDLLKIISDIELEEPLNPKKIQRKYELVIYFKGSEKIEDLLLFMGAQRSAFSLMDVKVEKDIRNRANRLSNCDSANLDKTIKTGLKQSQAIEYIIKNIGVENIPENLREIALIRLENPDMSLAEITENLSEPISRSGVNHRLKKLEKLAEEI